MLRFTYALLGVLPAVLACVFKRGWPNVRAELHPWAKAPLVPAVDHSLQGVRSARRGVFAFKGEPGVLLQPEWGQNLGTGRSPSHARRPTHKTAFSWVPSMPNERASWRNLRARIPWYLRFTIPRGSVLPAKVRLPLPAKPYEGCVLCSSAGGGISFGKDVTIPSAACWAQNWAFWNHPRRSRASSRSPLARIA